MDASFSIVEAPMPLVAPVNTNTFPLVRFAAKAALAATIFLVDTILFAGARPGLFRMKLFAKVGLTRRGR